VKSVVVVCITFTVPSLLFGFEDIEHFVGFIGVQFREHSLGVQESRIQFLGSDKVTAHNEDFSRDTTRGWRFSGFDFTEELLEDPEKFVVIFGSEDLGDKST
jgi:hypothetical protein